ncbi:MAG: DUF11 domain-containing protein [Microbacterium sp.]|nr:DUF11 domain-containing protein [Microbacterium sp.]
MVAVLAIVFGIVAPTAANADASSEPSITLEALTPSTQKSGTAFTYKATYACSNVNITACATGPTLTIPLGAAASFPVQVGASADITSWSVTGGNLVIHLVDLVEGASGTIGITITPPNHTTPNGTTWTLVPTMTFTDGTPTATAPGVTSTANATPSISTNKQASQTFYKPGDTAQFTIYWDCPYAINSTGVEDLSTMSFVDTLPAGLTYASSAPTAATVSGQTVTWNLTPAQMGERCSAGTGSYVPLVVNATVDAAVPDNTVLTNAVVASGTSLSGTAVTASASAKVTVVRTLPGATVTKKGYGPLLNNVGDGSFDLNLNGYRSATYAGPWLGRGISTNPNAPYVSNSTTDSAQIEAVYMLTVTMPQTGLQSAVVDPLPCTSNHSGASYSSNAPGDLCQDPAFHPTMVTAFAQKSNNALNVGVPAAFAPQARLTDGALVTLTPGPAAGGGAALANGPEYRTYFVPASAIGRVAELVFPRTDGMTNIVTQYAIGGYADGDRQDGDILKNQARVSSYAVGDDDAYATTTSSIGSISILGGPQIGLRKYWVPASNEFQLNAETFFPGPTTGDYTIVDTLPAGITYTGPVVVNAFRYTQGWINGIPSTTTQSIDPATGRSIVTIRIAAADLNALLANGIGERMRFEIHLPARIAYPGNYTNTATINLSDPAVDDSVCTQGTKVAGTAGAGFTCTASYAFTINPDPTSDAVRVSKSVKGSLDDSFKTNPAIGHVGADGGSATYRLSWTNKSVQTLGNVVAYDLLPRVGDTGTVAGTLNQQRGSTFRPSMTAVGALPAGMTASYSTSTNPCRPEVLPNAQNPGCVDDWAALPASPSAAVLDSIRALKFVSTSTYTFDTGFSVDLSMTTPPLESAADIAWNTFATAQTNQGNGEPLPPVESAKVGIARPDFSHITIDKVVDKPTAHVGDTLTYTVKAINDGGRDLTDVTLRDTLPAGMTFVSATGGGTYADGEVTWNLATMPLGQQFTYTIVARATVPDGSTLVNRWGVDGTTPVTPLHPCPDPNPDQESCASTTVPAVALTYAKTSDPAPGTAVKAGDTITYTVTAANSTADASTSGKVTDDLSGVLDTATLTSAPTLTCSPGANACGQVHYDAGDSSFTWTSSPSHPLAGGTTGTITYTVRIKDDATGTVGNVLVEPDITVEHPIIIGSKSVDKGDKAQVDPGETLTYTLVVQNTGAVDAASASAFDDLTNVLGNADLVADSIHASAGTATFDPATRHLVWNGTLAAGAEATVTYSVVVKADAHGQLRNAFLGATVVNPISGSLQWRKVDDGAEPKLLAGAEWTLTPLDEDGEPVGDAIRVADCLVAPCTGADADSVGGQFLVHGLAPGAYRLVESRAPDGYVLDGTPIAVTVSSTVQVTTIDDVVNHPEPTSTPTPTPSSDPSAPTPSPSPSAPGVSGLPVTGIDGLLTLTIGGIALGAVLVGAALLVARRRRRPGS